jgi:single-strand DNA-binding protein
MATLNLCQFIGNVGSIETRYLPNGEAVCNIAMAVNDKFKNKAGEMVEHTEWVRISFFSKLDEIAAQYVKLGDPIYVSGIMRTR